MILLVKTLGPAIAILRDSIGVRSVLGDVEGELALLVSPTHYFLFNRQMVDQHARDLAFTLHVALDQSSEGQVGPTHFLEVRKFVLDALLGDIYLFLGLIDDLNNISMKSFRIILVLTAVLFFLNLLLHLFDNCLVRFSFENLAVVVEELGALDLEEDSGSAEHTKRIIDTSLEVLQGALLLV